MEFLETADSHLDPKLVTKVGDQAGSFWGKKRSGQEEMSLRFFHSFKAIPEDSPQEPQVEKKTESPEQSASSQGAYIEGAHTPLDEKFSSHLL